MIVIIKYAKYSQSVPPELSLYIYIYIIVDAVIAENTKICK